MPDDTEERTRRYFIERMPKPGPQPSQHPARLVGAGGGSGDHLRRSGTGSEGRAGCSCRRRRSANSSACVASGRKPNILIIWGDDVGVANISAYSNGVMGYETPGIDRIGREGIKLLHYYGEQSCTAGRAAFLTGQHGIRSGLTKVGYPGAPMGMSQLDPSIGGLLKNLGYATGQFGKNHVGDRNEIAPRQ